jgi:type IV secretory pathway VirB2 component (pilin)
MYIVIGWIALQVAFGDTSQQADRTGALRKLSSEPFGEVALWILVVGFFGMALWRLSEAAFGTRVDGRKTSARLTSLAKAVLYVVLGYGVLKYALGLGAPQASNSQSVDLTATLMRHPGGQAAVVVIGLVLIGAGLYLGYESWKMTFLKELELGRTRARTRRVAAVRSQPGQAKGIDSSLRALATTPAGPLLLVLVAIGLIMFGLFSWCQARWRRF